MTRIKLEDSAQDIVLKMCDGNPGAIQALMAIFQTAEKIDPDSLLGPLGPILMLDTYEIYGSDIYILFNDKCDRDVARLMVLIRATQLGIMPISKLKSLADDQMRKVNITKELFKELQGQVCEQLPGFNVNPQ